MIAKFLKSLNGSASNDDVDSRRVHERRDVDNCIGMIDGQLYPVKNWSNGGVLLSADARSFSINETKDITLKFKLSNRVVDVAHRGRVLRKNNDQVVIEFSPLTERVSYKFKQIVDDFVTQEFLHSQQV